MKLISGARPEPWRIVITGVPGIGKSTLASHAPSPVFVDIEGSLDRIDCVRNETPITTWDQMDEMLRELYEMDDCKTVVIDTVSALEDLLTKKILEVHDNKATELSDKQVFPYGVGFDKLRAQYSLVFSILDRFRTRGKNVIFVAHEDIEKAPNPAGETYERYGIDMHKKSVNLLKKKVDGIFYAHYEQSLVKQEKGSDKKIAVGSGRRVLLTNDRPWATAKSRFSLPEIVDFSTPDQCQRFFDALDLKESLNV